jgi:hypothetical protein
MALTFPNQLPVNQNLTSSWGGKKRGGNPPPVKPIDATSPLLDQYSQYQQTTPQTAPVSYQTQTPTGITNAINATNQIPVGYTPAQELAMRNRVRSTDTAQNTGAMSRIRDYMASQGLGGSGMETSAIGNMMRDQNATRQGALSGLDISNAQLANQNAYQKGGMLNSLAGMGEGARQFDVGNLTNQQQFNTAQRNNMFQYGTTFDEQRRLAEQGRTDYQKQLDEWKKLLGLPDGTPTGTIGWGKR